MTENNNFNNSDINKYVGKVFTWMFIALIVSTIGAGYVSSNPQILDMINPFILLLIEFGLVFALSLCVHKLPPAVMTILFLIYAMINGISLSVILLVYSGSTVVSALIATAVTFGIFAILGYTTKKDLLQFSTLLFVALIGILIATLINLFFHSTVFELIISIISILVFIGLTAYDTQMIKHNYRLYGNNHNVAIISAFELYLDFINIFLNFLRIFADINNNRD